MPRLGFVYRILPRSSSGANVRGREVREIRLSNENARQGEAHKHDKTPPPESSFCCVCACLCMRMCVCGACVRMCVLSASLRTDGEPRRDPLAIL